jgi:hypothetical protein
MLGAARAIAVNEDAAANPMTTRHAHVRVDGRAKVTAKPSMPASSTLPASPCQCRCINYRQGPHMRIDAGEAFASMA